MSDDDYDDYDDGDYDDGDYDDGDYDDGDYSYTAEEMLADWCIGADCLNADPSHRREECFTEEWAREYFKDEPAEKPVIDTEEVDRLLAGAGE